jgi:tetratricopeptide (TPR) repeat protein
MKVLAPACVVFLAVFAYGTRERNRVWLTDEALWKDVTEKSPRNGRGLMNYGLTLMAKADYAGALDYFNRALAFTPNYYILEINMGIAYGAINNSAQAEAHFTRAISLAPTEASPHNFYGRWLCGVNRTPEGVAQLRAALQLNPDLMDARYTLMQVLANSGDQAGLRAAAQDTLARFPGDPTATSWLARAASVKPVEMTPEDYLATSLSFFRAGRFADCVQAAKQAIQLRPDYAEAWNNVGACYNSLSQWDQGIEACRQAIRFKPDFPLAKNNLAWAESQKAKTGH